MSGYKPSTTYDFECAHGNWAITGAGADGTTGEPWLSFEEMDKNGQEDSHIYGTISRVDGVWRVDEETRTQITMYFDESTSVAIEKYVQAHGIPEGLKQ